MNLTHRNRPGASAAEFGLTPVDVALCSIPVFALFVSILSLL